VLGQKTFKVIMYKEHGERNQNNINTFAKVIQMLLFH